MVVLDDVRHRVVLMHTASLHSGLHRASARTQVLQCARQVPPPLSYTPHKSCVCVHVCVRLCPRQWILRAADQQGPRPSLSLGLPCVSAEPKLAIILIALTLSWVLGHLSGRAQGCLRTAQALT